MSQLVGEEPRLALGCGAEKLRSDHDLESPLVERAVGIVPSPGEFSGEPYPESNMKPRREALSTTEKRGEDAVGSRVHAEGFNTEGKLLHGRGRASRGSREGDTPCPPSS